MDSSAQRLYVHRKLGTGPLAGKPVGIHTYDLRTGKEIHKTRIPSAADITGERLKNEGNSAFDLRHQQVYVEVSFGKGYSILALHLEQDAPRLILKGAFSIPRQPLVDDERLMFVKGIIWAGNGVAYVSRKSREVLAQLELPEVGKRLEVTGGSGHYVCAVSRQGADELHVFAPRGNRLTTAARQVMDWSWASSTIDAKHNRWIVAEAFPHAGKPQRIRIRVYDIPTLRVLTEFSSDKVISPPQLRRLEGTPLLVVLPVDTEHVLVFDLDTRQLVAQESLRHMARRLNVVDYNSGWRLFSDVESCYVGAFGCEWVQLLGIVDGR